MRYSIVSQGMNIQSIIELCIKYGGTDIKPLAAAKQVFCELDPEQAIKLDAVPGIVVKEVKRMQSLRSIRGISGVSKTRVHPSQIAVFDRIEMYMPAEPNEPDESDEYAQQRVLEGIQTTQQIVNLAEVFQALWNSYDPPLIGNGLTVAVLDTGVRSTHKALVGKIVDEHNCTDAPDTSDIFNHGTQIAHIIAGEDGAQGGVAPGAKIINVKVLDDLGDGTEEEAVEGISYVCDLVKDARDRGDLPTDELYPNIINISAGEPDDNDPYSPIRVACKAARDDYGLQIIAACGNEGPSPETVLSPACDENVVAVGGLQSFIFDIWGQSSRGPTLGGLVKPDMVLWAENIEGADGATDDGYIVKSGTSFSTPIISGAHGLLWEIARRVYGEEQEISWYDIIKYQSLYFVKPSGVSPIKDSDYGWGAPAISAVISRITEEPSTGFNVGSIMEFMMMAMVMGVMLKSMK